MARFAPVLVLLSVVLWIVATSGGQHLFVPEYLGEAFDSQAERFLRGDPGVDVNAIRPEAILIGGEARMYFGPFPAILRMPLNLIYPGGRGRWSRLSGFIAAELALIGFAGFILENLRGSALSRRAQILIGNASLFGFVFASPLLFLVGNASIYNEAMIWGFAWSTVALFFACRSRRAHGTKSVYALLGFSVCAAAALLSRATFGAPLVLIAIALAFYVAREQTGRRLAALLLPIGLGTLAFLLLSYARFGTWTGQDYSHYIDSNHREFALRHGTFDLHRVPFSFADYFRLQPPAVAIHPPFVTVNRHPYSHPSLFSLPFSEAFLSLSWSASWLIFGGCVGILGLFQKRQDGWLDRVIAAAFLLQGIGILSFFALAQRYTADLCPFLIFSFGVFLRMNAATWQRVALLILVACSSVVNFLGTGSWLANDSGLPKETRVFWSVITGNTIR